MVFGNFYLVSVWGIHYGAFGMGYLVWGIGFGIYFMTYWIWCFVYTLVLTQTKAQYTLQVLLDERDCSALCVFLGFLGT